MNNNETENNEGVIETGYKTEVRIMVENYYDVQQQGLGLAQD